MFSLDIQMQSIELAKGVIQNNDTIRVSITTLPGGQKQAFTFDAKDIKTANPFFTVNVDEKTKKILIVMRKKGFTESPILCSTVIESSEIPMKLNDIANTEKKIFKLLEPLQQSGKKRKDRKEVGQFEVEFTLVDANYLDNKKQINKKRNSKAYSKMEFLFANENENQNFMFVDLIDN